MIKQEESMFARAAINPASRIYERANSAVLCTFRADHIESNDVDVNERQDLIAYLVGSYNLLRIELQELGVPGEIGQNIYTKDIFGRNPISRMCLHWNHTHHLIAMALCTRQTRCKKLTNTERDEIIKYVISMFNHIEREIKILNLLPKILNAEIRMII